MLSVHLLLAIAHIHGLNLKSNDFVLAFPQADIDIYIWMELPEGMILVGDEKNLAYIPSDLTKACTV